jgi:hypothetical protein
MSLGRQTIGKYFDFNMLVSSILALIFLLAVAAILVNKTTIRKADVETSSKGRM